MLLDFNNQLDVFSDEYNMLLKEAMDKGEPNAHMLKFLKNLVKAVDELMDSIEKHLLPSRERDR
jgi:hypothetical protein